MNNKTSLDQQKLPESGAFFNFMRQQFDGESLFNSRHKRFFGPRYTSFVFLSDDQKYVAIKRKPGSKPTDHKYDIFQGFDKEEFFGSQNQKSEPFVCNRDNGEYVATLVTQNLKITKLTFSKDKKYCAAYSGANLDIFDLYSAQYAAINDDPVDKRVQIFPMFSMKANENVTYDKILGVYLGDSKDVDDNTWIAFQSKMFSLIHFVCLKTLKEYQGKAKIEVVDAAENLDNSIFFVDKDEIKVNINSINQAEEFWSLTEVVFSFDGQKAAVNSTTDVFEINLEQLKTGMNRVEKVSSLKRKLVDCYNYNDNDFLFVEKSLETREIWFWHTDPTTTSEIADETIDVAAFDMKSWKLLEVSILKNKTCRAIGVRGSEQVYIWEKTAVQKEPQYFEELFPTNLSALSMPYYAYSLGGKEILIMPLFEEDLALTHELPLEGEEEIQRLLFSSASNLFVITRCPAKDSKYSDFYAYKIQVDLELSERLGCSENSKKLAKAKIAASVAQSELVPGEQNATQPEASANADGQDLNKKPNIVKFGPFSLRPQLKEYIKSKETDLDEIFVNDTESGQQSRLDFVCLAEFRLYFASFNYDNEKSYENSIPQSYCEDIMSKKFGDETKIAFLNMLNEYQYVFQQEGGTSIKGLTIKDDKTLYTVKNLYTEFTYSVLRAQTDNKRVYLLLEDAVNCYLRVFRFKNSSILEQICFIVLDGTEPATDKFMSSFFTTRELIDGILIHDEQTISRVYQFGEFSSVQHFENYLPSSSKADRTLMTSKIIQSKHDRKLGLIFNYPKSGQAKSALFLPFLNDNMIQLTGGSTTQLSWIAHTNEEIRRGDKLVTETVSYAYQFNTLKWQLSQFDLAGICVNMTNFKNFRKYKILSIADETPKLLITSQDKDFLKILRCVMVRNSHKIKDFAEWNTTELYCDQPVDLDDPQKANKIQLFTELYKYQKEGYNFKFEINERKDFAVACIKEKIIKRLFLVLIDEKFKGKFFDVVIPKQQETQSTGLSLANLFGQTIRTTLVQPLLERGNGEEEDEDVEQKDEGMLGKAFGMELSETKIIVWSTYQIHFQDFLQIKTDTVELKQSNFTMFSHEFQQWKQSNLGKDISKLNDDDHSFESTIVEVFTRNEARTEEEKTTDEIQIKVQVSNTATLLMSYDVDLDSQISSFMSTNEADLFYDSYGDSYIYDKTGITKLDSGETYHEYHSAKTDADNDPEKKVNPGVIWGERLVPCKCGVMLLLGSNLTLPYSYLSYVQDSNPRSQSVAVSDMFFYPDDYYKIKGRNILHKYKYEPEVLEKIFECYWKIDRPYILSVLVPTADITEVSAEEFAATVKPTKLQNAVAAKNQVENYKKNPVGDYVAPELLINDKSVPAQKENKFQEGEVKMKIIYGKNIVEELVAVSYDKLVNQMLFMLSQLPLQYSFKILIKNYAQLLEFSRFPDHINKWFQQTDQLQQVRVIYTNLQQGNEEHRSNLSLLDSQFFEKYPVKPPQEVLDAQKAAEAGDQPAEQPTSCCSNFWALITGIFAVTPEDESRMIPVRISMMRTDWMFEEKGRAFLYGLIESDDISLFQNVHIQNIIEFQWKIFLPCYRIRVFFPFFFFSFIPFLVMAVTNKTGADGEPVQDIPSIIAAVLLSIYCVWQALVEFRELSQSNLREYFTSVENLFNFLTLSLIIIALYLTFSCYTAPTGINEEGIDERQKAVEYLRLWYCWGILVQTIVLLNYVKVFDFWATFVRSLVQIIKSAIPLLTTLFLFIGMNCAMFYVLSRNNPLVQEDGTATPLPGILTILINSYRLALGDFNIEGDFSNSPNSYTFWLIFLITTVVQLLIMLNMVVAVMSAAFDEVSATNEANIYKAKLQALLDFDFLTIGKFEKAYREFKYLYLLEIDPVVNDLGPTFQSDQPEMIINNKLDGVKNQIRSLNIEIQSVKSSCKIIQKKVDQLTAFEVNDSKKK